MRFSTLFAATAGLLATNVAADGAAIVSALQTIAAGTANLNSTLLDYDGDLLKAPAIVWASGEVLDDVNKGTSAAQASDPLNNLESITVYFATVALQNDLNLTLTNLINIKPQFQQYWLDGALKLDLELTKAATDELSSAIVYKVPSNLQSIAEGVAQSIDDSFELALAAFSS